MTPLIGRDLAEWRTWQQAQGLSERTIDERLALIARLPAVDTRSILELLSDQKLSPSTRATYYGHIRAFTKWRVLTERAELDPTDRMGAPRRPRGLPRPVHDGQLIRLLEAANRRRTRTMILLAALAGLRVHEIAKIHGSDVDPWTQQLRVLGKGAKHADIPMHQLLLEEAEHYPRNGYWFPSYEAQHSSLPHIGRQAVGKAIGDAMSRADIDATPHQLRHWYGTTLLKNGVDIRVVQGLMRHESIQSTQIYTLVDEEQERAGIATLHLPPATLAA